ncbi:uncharacterized protein N7515_003834 [Penicillium bovifimosum]|uniref:Uncharacterized protein n=1 Tax=Penicillium bovifimosum TaxID=126998 RepID=A0A9W9H5W5_9EURO|nr:uncharacterized protein N7515_003834 [Penicillium bovifimosum]KAJ5138986.1 hypothetical protein N7515_003834 [Penicillium bovifimosum]
MSYIARRGLSTLIPPKVASPNAIGAAQDAARMERVVTFYAGLPRGPAAAAKPTGLIGRYQARYFSGKNASGAPLVHAIAGILILGYSMEYYFHLLTIRAFERSSKVSDPQLQPELALEFRIILPIFVSSTVLTQNPSLFTLLPFLGPLGPRISRDLRAYRFRDQFADPIPGCKPTRVPGMFDLRPVASPDLSSQRQGTLAYMVATIVGTESRIVMAEQSNRDVVDQTLSGGEPSPSDVPASTNDNISARGDAGKTEHIAMTTATSNNSDLKDKQDHEETKTLGSRGEGTAGDNNTQGSTTDTSKPGVGIVATRVLELNGVTSASDGGDDTASQGGSESDASRSDSKSHVRSGSVKKPAAFKPVSFAKFSVNKVAGVQAPPKVPEKVPSTTTTPLGTPQPSSRPRLVAKTTLGMRDSFSKGGAGAGKPGGSGPDPSQVWNKNRPVAPAPQKHLTDEELKQQYGIHMTSRIQEDGAVSSEAKWADIDDDEDDWAPETIEWTDGTKVNLTQPHNDPPPPPSHREPKELPPVEPKATKEASKPAPKPTASVGPNAVVFKVGLGAERQARTASASSKGTNDKVPSSSTSPAPPSKSPWAALPPVERVSPVSAPVQPHQQRMPGRYHPRDDGHHAPMPMPPKEIAADDFNRAWKEPQSDLPRELFNPRSSQYEPVEETRRGPWRHDQHHRAPAVLQRPNDHPTGPAEPSAAFQTHRSSHQEGTGWGNRRRASSNVSGGSGGFGRRMSVGRFDAAPRYNDHRRGSQVNGLGDPALTGHEQRHGKDEMPLSGPNGTVRPAIDVGAPPQETQAAVPQVAQVPQEDPVALQERIMKEKRLEARQRRIEQEEKEEAAKKERIRQRLAAMGPAPEKKTESRNNAPPQSHPQTHPPPPPPSQLSQLPNPSISSPPKPPVPELTGAPKQYGLMKVHHPATVKKFTDVDSKHPNRRISSPPFDTHPAPPPSSNLKTAPHSPTQSKSSDAKLDEQHDSQWQGNLNVSTSPWSHPNIVTTSPSVKNPWKPFGPDHTLTLGNGIFDQPLGSFPPRENPLRTLGLDAATMSAPKFPNSQEPAGSLPSPEARQPSFGAMRPIGRPGPIGPPGVDRKRALEAWQSFHQITAEKEAQDSKNFMAQFAERHKRPPAPVSYEETWKKVERNEDGRRVLKKGHEKVVNNDEQIAEAKARLNANPLTSLDAPGEGLVLPIRHRAGKAPGGERAQQPFPPPPEEVFKHPAYSGDADHPLVNLPKTKPIVKLPPKALPAPPPAPAPAPTFASMAAAAPRNSGLVPSTSQSWQERFNTLLKSQGTVQKKGALAVTSASKEPLSVQADAVSVSFPNGNARSQNGGGDHAARQVTEQDEMFEDREPGSLPAVRVPDMAPQNSWDATRPSERSRGRAPKQVQAQRIPMFDVGRDDRDSNGNTCVTVSLPGSAEPKTVILPRKTGTGPPRNRNAGYGNSRPRNNTHNHAAGPHDGTGNKPRQPWRRNQKKPAETYGW